MRDCVKNNVSSMHCSFTGLNASIFGQRIFFIFVAGMFSALFFRRTEISRFFQHIFKRTGLVFESL